MHKERDPLEQLSRKKLMAYLKRNRISMRPSVFNLFLNLVLQNEYLLSQLQTGNYAFWDLIHEYFGTDHREVYFARVLKAFDVPGLDINGYSAGGRGTLKDDVLLIRFDNRHPERIDLEVQPKSVVDEEITRYFRLTRIDWDSIKDRVQIELKQREGKGDGRIKRSFIEYNLEYIRKYLGCSAVVVNKPPFKRRNNTLKNHRRAKRAAAARYGSKSKRLKRRRLRRKASKGDS